MTDYIRYILTDEKELTLPEFKEGVLSVASECKLVGDEILFKNETIGQVEINAPGDGLFEDDIELLLDFAKDKANRDALIAELQRATSMLTIKVVFILEHDEIFAAFDPIFDWLLANRAGLLADEGGLFFNAAGPVD